MLESKTCHEGSYSSGEPEPFAQIFGFKSESKFRLLCDLCSFQFYNKTMLQSTVHSLYGSESKAGSFSLISLKWRWSSCVEAIFYIEFQVSHFLSSYTPLSMLLLTVCIEYGATHAEVCCSKFSVSSSVRSVLFNIRNSYNRNKGTWKNEWNSKH